MEPFWILFEALLEPFKAAEPPDGQTGGRTSGRADGGQAVGRTGGRTGGRANDANRR